MSYQPQHTAPLSRLDHVANMTAWLTIVLCSAAITFLIGFCAGGWLAPTTSEKLWIYEYQSLIGAIATLIAAAIAWCAVQKQIRQTRILEENRRERSARAARAMLVSSLKIICNYCTKVSIDIDRLIQGRISETNLHEEIKKYDTMIYFGGALKQLESCCNFLNDQEFSAIKNLICEFQIVTSRTLSLTAKPHDHHQFSTYKNSQDLYFNIIDLAYLQALAANLFDFARGKDLEFADIVQRNNYESINNELINMGFSGDRYAYLHDLLRSRTEQYRQNGRWAELLGGSPQVI